MFLPIEMWTICRHLRHLRDLRLQGRRRTTHRLSDRGEGVISAAIAVLVMAGIGALMWIGFRAIWQDAEANTREKVAEIGQ